jgi:hypothetical protein
VLSLRLAGRLATFTLIAALLPHFAAAQQPAATNVPQPSLQEILLRLQENAWDYLANVPDFFADERVVSLLQQEGARDTRTTTDSVFRLVRSRAIGEAHTFTESREVKFVNRKAAKGEDLRGPTVFTGGFSMGLTVVSLEMSRCYGYTLEPPALLDKTQAIVISYALKTDLQPDDGCPSEKQSGRAWIDPATLHPLRVEMTTPNYKDNNGHRVLWVWSVDYAPATIDNKQFWMPKTVTSRADANDASGTWLFTATYSNYHKLNVSSHVITDVGGNPPPQ